MTKRILVVDDEEGFRDLWLYFLQPLGFEVTCALDGQQAVEAVKKTPFDLIFMDVHMPRMNGLDALKIIKSIRPEQRVVIFSSSSDTAYKAEDQALRDGALDCLYKPFGLDQVEAIISKTFGGQR